MITNSFRLIPVTWLHWSVCFVAKKKNPKKIKKIIKMWQKNHSKKINYKKHQPGRLKCVCLMTSWILLDSVLATRWRLLKISFKRSRAENNALIKLFSWLKFPLIWHFITKSSWRLNYFENSLMENFSFKISGLILVLSSVPFFRIP